MNAPLRISMFVSLALSVIACGSPPAPARSASTPAPVVAPAPPPKAQEPALTREDVFGARRQFRVQVLSFDASQGFGVDRPLADLVRIRITNGSKITLPCVTVLTKRYEKGSMVGSSRLPSIPTKDLGPGDSVEYDYYPKGHLDVAAVDKIAVEIEGIIDPKVEQFFCEIEGVQK
jgi:hypothetical protein